MGKHDDHYTVVEAIFIRCSCGEARISSYSSVNEVAKVIVDILTTLGEALEEKINESVGD